MPSKSDSSPEPLDSMCAVYAELVECELHQSDPDMDTVFDLLGHIKEHCATVPYAKGEVPEHLEDHLFEEGDVPSEEGVVVVDGTPMPRSAAELLEGGETGSDTG
jgi:hypothetical protein